MAELITLTVTQVQAADGAVIRLRLPVAATLVGVSVEGGNTVGAPTDGMIVVSDLVLDEIAAVLLTNWSGDWRSRHLGGAETPVALPAAASVGVTLYLNGGSTPTLDFTASLWFAL